jgi:hypothetical protein
MIKHLKYFCYFSLFGLMILFPINRVHSALGWVGNMTGSFSAPSQQVIGVDVYKAGVTETAGS